MPRASRSLLALCCLAVAASLAPVARAQAPARLVKDIRGLAEPVSSDPLWLVGVGSTAYFSAETPETGRSLWRSDGSAAGTVRVSNVEAFSTFAVGDTIFFVGDDGASGGELWRSDGTPEGTLLVKEIRPGSAGGFGANGAPGFSDFGGTLVFLGDDGVTGPEPWRSDGTEAGTMLLADVRPGPQGSFANNSFSGFASMGGLLFFAADDGTCGAELWRSDGTAAGTVLVKDVRPGSAGSRPRGLRVVNGALFFVADDGTHGIELWRSDGTEAGTALVRDIQPGSAGAFDASSSPSIAALDGVLFFLANDGASGEELWKSDGTDAGTALVKDIRPGSQGSSPYFLTVSAGKLFFSASGSAARTLWTSDGTDAGTVEVPGSPGGAGGLVDLAGTLLFSAYTAASGTELWRSDGSAGGTVQLRDIQPGPGGSYPFYLTRIGASVFFRALEDASGNELWRSDGTEAGTLQVANIAPDVGSSAPSPFLDASGTLYFRADDGTSGNEVWRSDGTQAGTTRLADIRAGPNGSTDQPSGPGPHWKLIDLAGALLFTADDGLSGHELWTSDGTEPGTARLTDFVPGRGDSFPCAVSSEYCPEFQSGYLAAADGALFFVATHPTYGIGLWKTDGTEAGTLLLYADPFCIPEWPVAAGPTLFFRACGLWKSDGTPAGTAPVASIAPVGGSLIGVGDSVYFRADDGASGDELWTSDGTDAGTRLVKDIRPGTEGSSPSDFTPVAGTLFFSADDGANGRELWRSDGTPAGTQLVLDIAPGPAGGLGDWWPLATGFFAAAGDALFFVAHAVDGEYALWKSDGTASGTTRVAAPAQVAFPSRLHGVDGRVVFRGCDDAGCEPWTSDGTQTGTRRVADVEPGAGSSNPQDFTPSGTLVFFSAATSASGRELWALPRSALLDSDGDGLDDATEAELGTDPNAADSDGDGLGDGAEVLTHATDPLDPDSDDDGASDGAELQAGTDPLDPGSVPPVEVPTLAGWGRALLVAGLGLAGWLALRARGSGRSFRAM